MEICHHIISIKRPPNLHLHFTLSRQRATRLTTTTTAVPISSSSSSSTESQHRVKVSEIIHNESLKILEWNSVCKQLSAFTSTTMGFSVARNGSNVPIGRSRDESQKLLDQTTAAALFPRPLDFSGIEDVSEIIDSSVAGQLMTVSELCAVRRTLRAAKAVLEQLEEVALAVDEGSSDRYSPLLEVLRNCDFQMELEQKIGFCLDCNLSVILDRASEDLEIIRSERKRNMENLDSLLKRESARIFQAGGIERPLITKRRSRMCIGIRATHRNLLPGGVILNVSSSGATYFMEPKEAVELNNMEVKLSNSEKAEERIILSLLTSEIAESELDIKFLLDRILDVDLAFARAAYARWMNGVCPILSSECQGFDSNGANDALSIDIGSIQHPLLLESSLRSLSDILASRSGSSVQLDVVNGFMNSGRLSDSASDFPVPIDIKIGCRTKVVVISGPNTGGKTASMKTLGLASLMSKAGMYLPAKNNPKIPWFDLVLADIGDHQVIIYVNNGRESLNFFFREVIFFDIETLVFQLNSLEQNLSTFSGHISRLCKIMEVASKESLVLIDEIGSGTDPSEGVALSASILKYLRDRVNLAVVTTHYADLSRLKENDTQFENAATEFSLKTLKPTYRILWGSTGYSNALSIAKSIGFDQKIIKRAQNWVGRLDPEKQQERKGLLYQSLMEERNKLETQARTAASIHSEIMDIYHEIEDEADDLGRRETTLKAKETQRVQQEVKASKYQIEAVVQEFEDHLRIASADQYNSLIKKSESAIASIVEAQKPTDGNIINRPDSASYSPQFGEQVHVKGLGDKLATVVEASSDDETILVQYGKIRVRVKKIDVRAIPSRKVTSATRSVRPLNTQGRQSRNLRNLSEALEVNKVSYGPLVQTSKNTVDLRGMRVEEALHHLSMAITGTESQSVLFIIHGMGTGVVKEGVLEILKNHPRVDKFEQESPMNYGCTAAYIK